MPMPIGLRKEVGMKRYISIILLLLTMSCGVAKKQQEQTIATSQHTAVQQNEVKAKSFSVNQQTLIDTSRSEFRLTIKPKGKFSYSTVGGYVGEAEYVTINGNHSKQTLTNKTQFNAEGLKLKEQNRLRSQQELSNNTKNTTKLKSSNSFLFLGILIAAIVLGLGYRKFFH